MGARSRKRGGALAVALSLALSVSIPGVAAAATATMSAGGTKLTVTAAAGETNYFYFSILNQVADPSGLAGPPGGPWIGIGSRGIGDSQDVFFDAGQQTRISPGAGCIRSRGITSGGYPFDVVCPRVGVTDVLVDSTALTYLNGISTYFDWTTDEVDSALPDFRSLLVSGISADWFGDLPGPTTFRAGTPNPRGPDTVSYLHQAIDPVSHASDYSGPGAHVSLDGVANDGYWGRRYDFVASGFREITGTGGDDVLIGGAGNDRIEGVFGKDILVGRRGNDFLSSEGGTTYGGRGMDPISFQGPTGIPGHAYCGPDEDYLHYENEDTFEADCEGGFNYDTRESFGSSTGVGWAESEGEYDPDSGATLILECVDLGGEAGNCSGTLALLSLGDGARAASGVHHRLLAKGSFKIRAGTSKAVGARFRRDVRDLLRGKKSVTVRARVRLRRGDGYGPAKRRVVKLRLSK